jgi:hypothetical protein
MSVTDRLREVQSRVKRESLLEREAQLATKSSESQKRITDAYRQLLSARKLLLFYHLLSIRPEALDSQAELLNSILRVFRKDNGYFIDRRAYGSSLLDHYQRPVKLLSTKLDTFAACCCSYLRTFPGFVDRFTFSVVPAFFGSFWDRSMGAAFGRFFEHMLDCDFDIAVAVGRVVFTIPEFGFFIDKIISEMKVKGRSVTPTTMIAFVDDFLKAWNANRNFCPAIVIDTIRTVQQRDSARLSRFFGEAFLRPATSYGRSYGLHEASFCWPPALAGGLFDAFSARSTRLIESLLRADCPVALPSYSEAFLVCPTIDSLFVFCGDDLCDIAALLGHCCKTLNMADLRPEISFPTKLQKNKHYHLFDLWVPADMSRAAAAQVRSDARELVLRDILTKVPLFPAHPASQAIVEMIKDELPFVPDRARLLIEVKIGEFERMISAESLADWVNLLERGFGDRERQRHAWAQAITFSESAATGLEFPLKNYLGDRLWPSTWVIQAELFERFLATAQDFDFALQSQDLDFALRFIKCADLWCRWRDSHGFTYEMEFFLFHDYVMKAFPFEAIRQSQADFDLNWPALAKVDKWAAQYKNKDATADAFRKESVANKRAFWKKALVDTPTLINPLPKRLVDALNAPTPGMVLQIFAEATRMCSVAMAEAGSGVQEFDEFLAVLLLVYELAKPEGFISKVAFFDKTFRIVLETVKKGLMTGKLGGTYLYECGKGFEQAIEHLRTLACGLVDAYVRANPKERPPYLFQPVKH